MGSQVKKVLRQGIWGSLTGGWYYDPRHSKFTNVFHLYTWLILMVLPFIFYMVPLTMPQWAIVCIYTGIVFAIFASIKMTNYRLHAVFDEGNVYKREVIPPEGEGGTTVTEQLPTYNDVVTNERSEITAADAFPIAGRMGSWDDAEAGAGAGGDNTRLKSILAIQDEMNKNPESGAGARDVEVSIHADMADVFPAESNNNRAAVKTDRAVKQPKRRRARHRERSGTEPVRRPIRQESSTKRVAFAESPAKVEKARNVSRCQSLPSATSDSDSDSYEIHVSSESNDSSTDTPVEKKRASTSTDRTNGRPHRRHAFRGVHHHPWYKETDTEVTVTKRRRRQRRRNYSVSSDGDEWPKPGVSNSKVKSKEKEITVSTERSQPDANWFNCDWQPTDVNANSAENPKDSTVKDGNSTAKADKSAIEIEKDLPTSDQELLDRDPVLQARSSMRYSSNRRPFFRRRAYTVNSTRQVRPETDRRRLSTVPPYNGRRFSPPRRTSLQKLLSLWNREQNSAISDTLPSSPGEVSPGEVRLKSHTVNNFEFQDLPNPPSTSKKSVATSWNTNENNGEDSLKLPVESDQKSETSSHNSNPHFSETHTPERKAEENQKSVSSSLKVSKITDTKIMKQRPRKAKRTRSNEIPLASGSPWTVPELPILDENRLGPFRKSHPDSPIPQNAFGNRLGFRSVDHSNSTDTDSETDMNEFVNNLIGATATWQGNNNDGASNPVADQELVVSSSRKSRPTTGDADIHASKNQQMSDTPMLRLKIDGLPQEADMLQTQRPSIPSMSDAQEYGIPQSLPVVLDAGEPTRVRRTRHPAGGGETHTKLTYNTSEEGSGAAATSSTIQQLSANSITSTTGLIENAEDACIPSQAIEKLKEKEDTLGRHIATAHDDTTTGAMHTFQDEHGNWLSYTFGEASGTAQVLSTNAGPPSGRSSRTRLRLRTRSASVQDGDSSDDTKSPQESATASLSRRLQMAMRYGNRRQGRGIDISTFLESDVSDSFAQPDWPDMSPIDFIFDHAMIPPRRPTTPKVKLSYKFNILPFKSIILRYDRLALLDLLDRNRHIIENIFSTLLAVLVAVLGLVLLQKSFFYDIWPLWFCVVIATAQYSLIRSVQPDSASQTHGHNRVIAYSRPIYFCILALLILVFDYLGDGPAYVPNSYVYAGIYFTKASCLVARNVLLVFIMVLPFVFLFGLLPQINTFVMYLSEQTEIHVFGGSACNGLPSALFSITRSILFSLVLFGFCYGGMKTDKQSQHILFSVFCGLLVSISYHLSRQTNDPTHLWKIIRTKLFPVIEEPANENVDPENGDTENKEENPDKLSAIYVQKNLSERLQSDLIVCPFVVIFAFAIHCSTAFTVLQPALSYVLYVVAGILGFVLHYLLPQLRKRLPWLLFSSPLLKSREYELFEVQEEAKVMWFEKAYVWLCVVERNIIYPLVVMNQLTADAGSVVEMYGLGWGCVILTFVGLKLMRSSYGITLMHYIVLTFSALYSNFDARRSSDTTLVTYFLVSILFVKFQDMLLKLQFIYVYIAPWQISWGSTFHAFAQPISVPHSGMLLVNTVISSLLHAPLTPFLGSAIFLTSYMRPLKFWEKNYNTKRIDHSNTRLASQIDRGPSTDDNNLNSIFYEHLTLSLQKSLCGDIAMGRWGTVYPGDCFVMASDYLNALVHIIQKGNGVITFQVRGLEFGGTYCQQREVEAISETFENRNCCCCSPGHPRNMLSVNMAFHRRWLAWQIQTNNFVLDGYSITDNSATSMFGVYDLRKVLLSYMVKGVLYFLITHDSLEKWLNNPTIMEAMLRCEEPNYTDADTSFSVTIHDDYDMWLSGISRTKFNAIYGQWIGHCASKREEPVAAGSESKLVTLCFMVSVLSRRALGTASSHLTASHVVLESFLYGLHSLFKGDFRITAQKDEWVFSDMDILHHVVVPGVRMALKLHQDQFQNVDDYNDDQEALYQKITENVEEMVITHEGDPEWRRAVLSNRNSLLALRHVSGDSVDNYFVVTLKKRFQGFLIVRINRECVKGLWAGQQQELVFLRNSNPERGSIQNAKQVLRNMINSSCDQPIGYPIYVSPVTTSFSNTHPCYKKIAGRTVSIRCVRNFLSNVWNRILQSCGGGCNSGGSAGIQLGHNNTNSGPPTIVTAPIQTSMPPISVSTGTRHSFAGSQSSGSQAAGDQGDQFTANRIGKGSFSHRSLSFEGRRIGRFNIDDTQVGSVSIASEDFTSLAPYTAYALGKRGHKDSIGSSSSVVRSEYPATNGSHLTPPVKVPRKSSGDGTDNDLKSTVTVSSTSLSSKPRRSKHKTSQKVQSKEFAKIEEPNRVLATLEISRPIDYVKWPNDEWRKCGGKSKWGDWSPKKGTVGEVVFKWYPNHRNPNLRSHIGEVIVLLQVQNPSSSSKNPFYVPIPEKCTSAHKPEIETTQL